MTVKNAWKITRLSFSEFFSRNILKLSGSLAFFTIFFITGLTDNYNMGKRFILWS